jgi:diguanylate cyclase (GGDEF)-like protein
MPGSERSAVTPATWIGRAWPTPARLVAWLILAVVYHAAAKFGLELAYINANTSAVWPAAGIALAAILLFGYRVWPGILIGAFTANWSTAGTLLSSAGIAAGNTLGALLAAALVTRFANGRRAVERAPDIARFVLLAGLLATMVPATLGSTTLAVSGLSEWTQYGSIWLTWWLGDAGGTIMVTPAILLWTSNPRVRLTGVQALEAVALLLGLALVGLAVFGGLPAPGAGRYPLEFLCVPFLVWAAYRFGPRETATVLLLLSSIATWGTLSGSGPFARPSPNESLLLLQAFTVVNALMGLVLATVVSERAHVEEKLRRLAVTDPLTGLANYRQLMEVLEGEIVRSDRTGRPFSVLFLDLDNLKRINDQLGHMTGSRALCRVGSALAQSCRALDTAARFGGDEFALVLPESDEDAARHVAGRVAAELAGDGEEPLLSVSVGVAVYPRDGLSAETLLARADALLYDMKAGTRIDTPVPGARLPAQPPLQEAPDARHSRNDDTLSGSGGPATPPAS